MRQIALVSWQEAKNWTSVRFQATSEPERPLTANSFITRANDP
jgi:hypothetical protein